MKRTFPRVQYSFLLFLIVFVENFAFSQQSLSEANTSPEAEFHMARMIYSSSGGRAGFGRRGWWDIDYPSAEFHFIRGIRRLSRLEVAEDSQHIQLTDESLFDYPWLFAQQVGRWSITSQEALALREYLDRGGFLVADDFHGEYEWQVFAEAMKRVFPHRLIVEVDSSDEVFHVLYDLEQGTQIPGERHLYRAPSGEIKAQLEGPQAWRGIYDEKGRLVVAINFNMDMGDSWEHADDAHYPEPMTALGYRFGINYVIYAMTH